MSLTFQVWNACTQAAFLSSLSNIIAQASTFYRSSASSSASVSLFSSFDSIQFAFFVLFAYISTPPNYVFQKWLEDTFPTYEVKGERIDEKREKTKGKTKLSIENTAVKLLIDQTVGAPFNTLLFIVGMGWLKGLQMEQIWAQAQIDFWPMLKAGYCVWPLVSLVNLTVIPFDKRMLVAGTAGVAWGIYLSLIST